MTRNGNIWIFNSEIAFKYYCSRNSKYDSPWSFGFHRGTQAAFTRIIEIRYFKYNSTTSTYRIFPIPFSTGECELLGIKIKPNDCDHYNEYSSFHFDII